MNQSRIFRQRHNTAFYHQLGFVIVGLAVLFAVARLDYRFLGGVHWVLYALGIASLLLVVFFGRTVNGTKGWFEFGGFQLQPVEFVKIILCIVLAKYFSDHVDNMNSWRLIFMSGLITGAPVVLVMLQPDAGSALLMMGIWFGLLLALPIPRRRIGMLLLVAVVAGVASWFLVLRTYQKDRILNFVSPTRDQSKSGYNVQQAITAVGSGQWIGRGLGLGTQSQLSFLPERQTDFIFASISEELGFVGAGAIVALFAIIFWRMFVLSQRSRDNFSVVLSIGLAMMIFIQVFVNIGMNIGVFPVAGIPLPFISYGGSSLLSSMVAIGLAESLAIRQRILPA